VWRDYGDTFGFQPPPEGMAAADESEPDKLAIGLIFSQKIYLPKKTPPKRGSVRGEWITPNRIRGCF